MIYLELPENVVAPKSDIIDYIKEVSEKRKPPSHLPGVEIRQIRNQSREEMGILLGLNDTLLLKIVTELAFTLKNNIALIKKGSDRYDLQYLTHGIGEFLVSFVYERQVSSHKISIQDHKHKEIIESAVREWVLSQTGEPIDTKVDEMLKEFLIT